MEFNGDLIQDLTLTIWGVILEFCDILGDDQWWLFGIRIICGYIINVAELSVSFIANGNLYNNESFASPTNSYESYCTVISLYSLVLFFLFITLILTCCQCVAYKATRIILSIIFTIMSILISYMLFRNSIYLQNRIPGDYVTGNSWDGFLYFYGIYDFMFTIVGFCFRVLRFIDRFLCCNKFEESSKRRKLIYCTIVISFEAFLAFISSSYSPEL